MWNKKKTNKSDEIKLTLYISLIRAINGYKSKENHRLTHLYMCFPINISSYTIKCATIVLSQMVTDFKYSTKQTKKEVQKNPKEIKRGKNKANMCDKVKAIKKCTRECTAHPQTKSQLVFFFVSFFHFSLSIYHKLLWKIDGRKRVQT